MKINRYLLFISSSSGFHGGWQDFISSHNSLEEAVKRGECFEFNYHIVDLFIGQIVYRRLPLSC